MERTDFEQWKGREVARLLALVETERRYYQEMVASLPVALAVLSPDRSVVSANRAFRQTFGLTVEEVRKKVIEQILPSDALIEKIRDMHLHGLSRAPFPVESNGKIYRVAIVPIHNWNEDMELETLLMVEDLSELRSQAGHSVAPPAPVVVAPEVIPPEPVVVVEPEIVKTGAFEPSDLEHLPAVVWQADAWTLAFSAVGGSVEALLGYAPSHWTQSFNFFLDRIHPDDRDSVISLYRSAIDRGGEASAEFRAVTATGATVWCRETVLAPPATTEQGSGATILCGVLTKISQRKQAERQMVTAERHAALSGISARLAHDLNNPLMIITGYSEEMQHGFGAEDPRRDDIDHILTATQRISDLTTQLLHFNRRSAAASQPTNLAAELRRIEQKLAESVGETALLEVTGPEGFGDDAVWAQADPAQLENVLLALVSPAREDAEGRSRVTIAWDVAIVSETIEHGVLSPGKYARIVVEDNGKGLNPAKRAALFESFLAKDAGRNEGVALSYAYSAIREWGGDIAVESDPFYGTRFSIYLLVAEPVAPIPEPEPPPFEASSEIVGEVVVVEPELPQQRIMVVDDEPGIRALVAKILRREKYFVLEAGTAREAMNIIAQHEFPIELLVTDVMLPDQSGRDLADHVSQAISGVKILYISGFTDDESVRTGDFPPGAKFLQKPFTLGALVGRVREAMES